MRDTENWTIERLSSLIANRTVSPVEVAHEYLDRIERRNPELNAVVTIAPDVLDQALALEHELAQRGARSPLHGIPLTIKDTIFTRGLRTTSGSLCRAEFIPDHDAAVVKRLREAGAIILGKTNTAEMACAYETDNPVFGRTNHPLHHELTPGGSSGGEAAAVFAGISPGGIGSDLMGSIRVPAHFCGIAGLKPGIGTLDTSGHFPPTAGALGLGAVIGPMAATVADLQLLWNALAARVPSSGAQAEGASQVKVAVYFSDLPITDETACAVRSAGAALAAAGYTVDECNPPGVDQGTDLWTRLFAAAAAQPLIELYDGREHLAGPLVSAMIARQRKRPQPAGEFVAACEARNRLKQTLDAWMEDWQLIVAPVGAVPAFAHGQREHHINGAVISTFQAFGYCQTFSVFGLPAVVVNAGRSKSGLPIGVQVIAGPFGEAAALAAALVIERGT